MKVDYPAFLTKLAILALVFALTPFPWSILYAIVMTWGYPYVIAFFNGVIAMPTMDQMCFLGDDDIRINFISFCIIEKHEFEKVKGKIRGFMKDKAKLRWKIEKIWGDYYWKDTTIDESIDYVFQRIPKECHSERDIEAVVNEDLNNEMPKDRP